MATVEHPTSTAAEDRAWDLFFEALGTEGVSEIPPGAAIVAADAADRDELIRRYRAEHRSVVLVHSDGSTELQRAVNYERWLIYGCVVAALVWIATRSGHRSLA